MSITQNTLRASILALASQITAVASIGGIAVASAESNTCTYQTFKTLRSVLATIGVALVIPDQAAFDKDPQKTTSYVVDSLGYITAELRTNLDDMVKRWSDNHTRDLYVLASVHAAAVQATKAIQPAPDAQVPVKDLTLTFDNLPACDGNTLVVTPMTLQMFTDQTALLTQDEHAGRAQNKSRFFFGSHPVLPEVLNAQGILEYKRAVEKACESLYDYLSYNANASVEEAAATSLAEMSRFITSADKVNQYLNEALTVVCKIAESLAGASKPVQAQA